MDEDQARMVKSLSVLPLAHQVSALVDASAKARHDGDHAAADQLDWHRASVILRAPDAPWTSHQITQAGHDLRTQADDLRAAMRDADEHDRPSLEHRCEQVDRRVAQLYAQGQDAAQRQTHALMQERMASGQERPLHDHSRRKGLDFDRREQFEDLLRQGLEDTPTVAPSRDPAAMSLDNARLLLVGIRNDSPEIAVQRLHEARSQLDLDEPGAQEVANRMHDRTAEILDEHPELDFSATQWTPGAEELRAQYGVTIEPEPLIDSPGIRRRDAEDPAVTPERLENGARELAARGRPDESPERKAKRDQAVGEMRARADALRTQQVRDHTCKHDPPTHDPAELAYVGWDRGLGSYYLQVGGADEQARDLTAWLGKEPGEHTNFDEFRRQASEYVEIDGQLAEHLQDYRREADAHAERLERDRPTIRAYFDQARRERAQREHPNTRPQPGRDR